MRSIHGSDDPLKMAIGAMMALVVVVLGSPSYFALMVLTMVMVTTAARTSRCSIFAVASAARIARRTCSTYTQTPAKTRPVSPQTAARVKDPAAGSPADLLATLKQLGELKSQGVLSEEEFAEQKRRIGDAISPGDKTAVAT